MKLYRLLIHTDSIRYPYPVVLQGAFYALLDWIDPDMAQSIHDRKSPKLSIFWNKLQSHLEIGMCGDEWKQVFPLQELKGVDWRFGEETVRIHQIRMAEISKKPIADRLRLNFLSPILLRDQNRKAVLEPDLMRILASACRKAEIQIDLSAVQNIQIFPSINRVFTDYKYQREPGFMGFMDLDFTRLGTEKRESLEPAFSALDVLGCGAKTMMGFGRVSVSEPG